VEVLDRDFEAALRLLDSVQSDAYSSQWHHDPKSLIRGQILEYLDRSDLAEDEYRAAQAVLEDGIQKDPADSRLYSSLGLAFAGLSLEVPAVEAGQRAVELLPISAEALRGAYRLGDLAEIYVRLGRYDDAVQAVERLLGIPGRLTVPLLEIDPTWDPLRDHPRFQALLERYAEDVEH
jgi:serine/threonine-protein kinase